MVIFANVAAVLGIAAFVFVTVSAIISAHRLK